MDGIGVTANDHDGESISTQSDAGTDGMLNHENEELRDRVSALEKKVQQHEDEVICLKSALSDALRRLSAVESGKAFQNSVLPSKPSFRSSAHSQASSRRSVPASPSPSKRDYMSHQGRNSPTPSRVVPRGAMSPASSGGSSHSLRKWPSTPSTVDVNGHLSPSARLGGSLSSLSLSGKISSFPHRGGKEPSYNQDEGLLRIYLRGRAVSMYAPSDMGDYDISKLGQPPTQNLKLEWVYGYRGKDARSNIYLLPTGEIVYFIAAVVVLYNVEEQMQRHYTAHTDDVKCIAVHPDKITMATGQVAGHDKREGKRKSYDSDLSRDQWPHVRIWDSVSLNTLHVIGLGDFDRAVACVAFSKADGGSILVAVDEANEHIISCWDWAKGERGHKITETKSSTEPVIGVEFHPCDKNIVVTCGKSHLGFWTIEGGTMTKKLGIYEKYDKPKFVTTIAFAENGDLLTGDTNGNIFVWGRGTNRISQALLGAHEGAVFSVCITKDGTVLSGGKDRKIIQWSNTYQKTGVETQIGEQYGSVRMLSQGKGNMILVGTTRNNILQGTLDLEFSPIIQGHVEELWGLATHPNQNQLMTCGYDRSLYLWDTLTHSAIWCKEMPESAHCVAFHPEASIVIVGMVNARWIAIDSNTRDLICTHTDGNEQLECLEFSPDGKMLAVGSRDNYIYLYHVSDGGKKYQRQGRCSGHSSFVTHIDWSVDGQYLQSNSGDYELLFWSSGTGKQVTSPSSLRDVQWATQNCTLSFNACGVWPEGADGTDVNACSRSNKQNLLASADDFGKVNLFAYPCCQPKSSCHTYPGHSSHVTNVKFLYDDSRLLTTGGKDTAILQWEVL